MNIRSQSRSNFPAQGVGRSRERGSALIVAMFVALVVTGLCTTMLLTSNANHLISANERDHDRALFASKAGLNYGYHLLASKVVEPSSGGAAFDSFDTEVSAPLDGGSFVGQVFDDGNGVVRLVSTGIYRRASRTTEIVLQTTPTAFRFGFVGYNGVELHVHRPLGHDGLQIEGAVISNNYAEVVNHADTVSGIQVDGPMIVSGTLEITGDTGTTSRIEGDVYAYSVENDGVIDGDVRLLASVAPTHGTPDVTDEAGAGYAWYLDRNNPDYNVQGGGTITGEVSRHVVHDGERFESSIFSDDGSLLSEPDVNVMRPMEPPKLDYQAMKAAALENDPTYFRTEFQLTQYLKANRVTETVGGETVTTIKIGSPGRPEFLYVQEAVELDLDNLGADALHIEGGLYTSGDFVFVGNRYIYPEGLPEGYDQLRINALPYCLPAIVSYSEPRYGENSDWTPADTPPMMSENQSEIMIRSHHIGLGVSVYEGPVSINGLTYAEYESHFHRREGEMERLTFNGAQLGYTVHNCDFVKFTYDPAVSCTRFLEVDGASAAGGDSTIVSYRELR